MKDIQANKRVCVQFFDLVCERNMTGRGKLLKEDVEWWVNGDFRIRHLYGPDAVVTACRHCSGTCAGPASRSHFTAITAERTACYRG